MLNVRRAGPSLVLLAFALGAPANAQTYHDSGGTIPLAVVPLVGCSSGGNCSGPVSNSNPMPVSGTFSATLSGFTPGGAYASPLVVSTTSARVALPAGTTVVVYNPGASTAYVILGNSSVAATASDDVIPAGGWMAFTVGSNGYLAAITASGTTTLNLSGGSGLPTGAGGGGSGGSSSNASVSATGSGVPSSGTYAAMNVSGNLTGLTGTANGLKVDPSAVTQPVSAASLPLPSGASVAANQTNVQSAPGTSQTAAVTVQGNASGIAVPVSAASLPLPSGAATSANQEVTVAGTSASSAQGVQGVTGGVPLATNQSQINGVAQLAGNGPTGAGAQRVTLSQDNSSVAINVSTATTTQLVAISGSTSIYVTSFDVIAGGAGNITFEYGTGSNCGTGTTALTGAYPLVANGGISKGSGVGTVLKVPSGNALCALTSAAVQMSGSLSYVQF